MITLTLTTKLIPTANAILFSEDLDKNLKEFQLTCHIFYEFCSVCRIFTSTVLPSINSENNLQSKIQFEIHSGSMFQDEEWLYRELNILIFCLHKSSINFSLSKHT